MPHGLSIALRSRMDSSWQIFQYGVEITTRVFVGGVPFKMTEKELEECFIQYGPVKDAKIITDRHGLPRGYGFVTYHSEEDAIKVQAKGSIFYKEKKLNVSKAIRKQGGQFSKSNQEYVNGQRQVFIHPDGYLLSQHKGTWYFEAISPHSQPAKPCYSLIPPMYHPTPYMQTPPIFTSPATTAMYSNPNYAQGLSPALPFPTSTYPFQTSEFSSYPPNVPGFINHAVPHKSSSTHNSIDELDERMSGLSLATARAPPVPQIEGAAMAVNPPPVHLPHQQTVPVLHHVPTYPHQKPPLLPVPVMTMSAAVNPYLHPVVPAQLHPQLVAPPPPPPPPMPTSPLSTSSHNTSC